MKDFADNFCIQRLSHRQRQIINKNSEKFEFLQSYQADCREINQDILDQWLASSSKTFRYAALSYMLWTEVSTLPASFKKLFDEETDEFLILKMILLVQRTSSKDYVNILKRFLVHKNNRIRSYAVEALATLDYENAKDYMKPLLSDSDNRVMANLIFLFGKSASTDVIDLLHTLLGKKNNRYKQSVLYVVNELKLSEAEQILCKTLYDSNPRVRDRSYLMLKTFTENSICDGTHLLEETNAIIENKKLSSGEPELTPEAFDAKICAERDAVVALAKHAIDSGQADKNEQRILSQVTNELTTPLGILKDLENNKEKLAEGCCLIDTKHFASAIVDDITSIMEREESFLYNLGLDVYEGHLAKGDESPEEVTLRENVAKSLYSEIPELFALVPSPNVSFLNFMSLSFDLYKKFFSVVFLKTLLSFVFFIWLVFLFMRGTLPIFHSWTNPTESLGAAQNMSILGYTTLFLLTILIIYLDWSAFLTILTQRGLSHRRTSFFQLLRYSLENHVYALKTVSIKFVVIFAAMTIVFMPLSFLSKASFFSDTGISLLLKVLVFVLLPALLLLYAILRLGYVEECKGLLPLEDAFVLSARVLSANRYKGLKIKFFVFLSMLAVFSVFFSFLFEVVNMEQIALKFGSVTVLLFILILLVLPFGILPTAAYVMSIYKPEVTAHELKTFAGMKKKT
ncbi:MAG: hypothetical protein GX221_09135 [Candidatus Riflebacteria bacterium]|nr:hypothetical protein [Candidatus Riflebacteria bacterium]